MAKFSSLTVELELQQASFQKGMADAAKHLKRVEDQAKKTQESMSGMERGLKQLAAGAAALATAFAVFKGLETLVKATDQIANLTGSFKALLGSSAAAADMMIRVFGIVDRTGAPLEAVGGAVQRLTIAMKSLGASNAQIETVAETFIQLGKVGGSSAAETASGLQQLGQALASGKLGGDELKSIRENTPLVAEAIAQAIGVTSGQLKQLGEDGKLTSDVVANALLASADKAKAGFAAMPVTFEQAMNRMEAQSVLFFASFDKASQVSGVFLETANLITAALARWRDELENSNGQWTLMKLAAEALKIALQALLVILSDVAFVAEGLARSFAAAGVEAYNLLTANWSKMGDAWKDSEARTAAARIELDKYQKAVLGLGDTMDKVFGKVYGGDGETGGFPAGTPRKLKPPPGGAGGAKGKSEAEKDAEALRKRGEALAASVDPLNAYNQKVAEYNELLAKAAISSVTWSKAMEQAKEGLTAQGDALTASVDPLFAYELEMRKINQAYRDGQIEVETWVKLQERAAEARDRAVKANEKQTPLGEMLDQATELVTSGISDFFKDLIEGSMSAGEAFRKMVVQIIGDLAKLLAEFAAKQAAKFIISTLFSGAPSVGAKGAAPALAMMAAPSWSAARSLGLAPAAAASEGGVQAVGGARGNPWQVTVNNYAPGVDVTTQAGTDGGLEITVARVKAALTADVVRGGNPFARSLEHTYGVGRGR